MTQIPDAVKEQLIGNYLEKVGSHDRPDITAHDFSEGLTVGYNLSLAEKDAAVKYVEKVAYETSKKNADLMAEIERLKGLLKDMFYSFRDTDRADEKWIEYCKQTNL